MASTRRGSPRHLDQELLANPTGYGFFQTVRLLSLAARKRGDRRGPLPAGLRFRTLANLAFPASELTRYSAVQTEDGEINELEVAFMGLTGPSGVLPNSYTELLIERRQQFRDPTLHAFLDIFSHRAISLFYGAWKKYRFWLQAESGEQDGFSRNLLDLGGMGLSALRAQMGKGALQNENLFVYYAGLLSQKPMSGQALTTLIEGFFGFRAELVQFAGQWMNLPESEQSQLGGSSCELGLSAFAGDRIWDRQTKLNLRLGPLRLPQFSALQPDGEAANSLRELLKFALGHGLACDVTLILDKQDVPEASLAGSLRLGGSCWLGSPEHHPEDMAYCLVK
ncbi:MULTISPECIES: type VI secretion system baseplate subunit TssG [unclassified Iodobacter]|uniref:type VI secretion system baseplate subunit TssG n=1 Tax=unclassified Iodobacter TaxID=235634 RepID=UPI0025FA5025|nr:MULTISPECIES: type VI secretion system baseplate subunit TssG [unclassified Iodobacter]MDW5418808.1 type VI secretion system baseplate subunit TssG [Iodobacter sp. CM08]